MKVSLRPVHHDRLGFAALAALHEKAENLMFREFEVDMSAVSWLDADMCAPLGAVVHDISSRPNTVKLSGIQPQVETILSRNGFLSSYGRAKLPDAYSTTISYRRFSANDSRSFAEYIERGFVGNRALPKMSSGLLKKFRESVFEIFDNAAIHSETKLGVFCCGQLFPRKSRLVVSITDLGIGIRANLEKQLGLKRAADEAISWATEGRNTTKRGAVPGGVGLKILREFITLNRGILQIVSDRGYWRLCMGSVETALLDVPFPGTTVTLDIDTSDRKSYKLSSEIDESDIL